MRVGDRLAVQIEGMNVAEAVIEDLEDGTATIVIPATRLVVKVRQTLDIAATREPEVDRVLAGVVDDRPESSPATEELNIVPPTAPIETPTSNLDVGEGIHNKNLDSSAID